MNRHVVVVAALGALLCTLGCGSSGVICGKSETRCGNTCADLQSNPEHCGACGITCAAASVCIAGRCTCPAPQTACGQACVDLSNSGGNCGACGQACSGGDVCDRGACVARCGGAGTVCGGGCVDTQSDAANCGGCGVRCGQGQSCRAGACGSDLYAACFNSGGLYGLSASTLAVTPQRQVAPPSNPVSLALHGDHTLEVADTSAQLLYSFDLTQGIVPTGRSLAIGAGPTAVRVAGDLAVVVNSGDGTLDLFDLAQDGGTRLCPPATPGCAATAVLGAGTYPGFAAVTDQAIYVSLQGDVTKASDPAGNQVAIVSRADYSVQKVGPILPDLSNLPDAGPIQARPQGLAVAGNQLFVALADLGGDTHFDAVGPGEVAVFDIAPAADGGSPSLTPHGLPVKLGDGCRNAGAVLLAGTRLFVACEARLDSTTLRATSPGAVAALDTTTLTPAFAPTVLGCPAGASGCQPGGAQSLALSGGKLFIGDELDGRIFVADPATGQLSAGPANPIDVCLAPDGGFDYVIDLVARP